MHLKKIALLSVAAMLVLGAAPSFALSPEAQEYKEKVEPICQANTKANEKILKNVKSEVKAEKLAPAGASLIAAGKALKKTWNELSAVPQPSESSAKLTKWLGYVKGEAELFEKAGTLLKAGKKAPAQQIVNKLSRNANLANFEVVSFGFRYCKFEPSKFL